MCVFGLPQPQQAAPWCDVLKYIQELDTICFKYTLGVAKSPEGGNFEYKYDGPPLTIVDDVDITADQDVHLIGDQVKEVCDVGMSALDQICSPKLTALITPYSDVVLIISIFLGTCSIGIDKRGRLTSPLGIQKVTEHFLPVQMHKCTKTLLVGVIYVTHSSPPGPIHWP